MEWGGESKVEKAVYFNEMKSFEWLTFDDYAMISIVVDSIIVRLMMLKLSEIEKLKRD